MKNTYVVIMAGGIGSRFWPYSRTRLPKQFLDIMGTGKSLLQTTYERFLSVCAPENVYVVTGEAYADLVATHLPDLTPDQVLTEPLRRNTAPCVLYAAQKIHTKDPDATLIISPSDHLVRDQDGFTQAMRTGVRLASTHPVLLTLGITPSRPDTGYGYIQFDEASAVDEMFKVKTFTEKPTRDIAETFLKSGDFLWNSGMFIWRADTVLDAIAAHLPDMFECFADCPPAYSTPDEQKAVNKAYMHCTDISIDFGIMEKADNVHVLPADFGWSDVGTWTSLYDVLDHDYLGNAVVGDMCKIYDAAQNMVVSHPKKLVVLNGVQDLCIIDTDDALLIMDKGKEQEVKQILNDLKVEKLDDYL